MVNSRRRIIYTAKPWNSKKTTMTWLPVWSALRLTWAISMKSWINLTIWYSWTRTKLKYVFVIVSSAAKFQGFLADVKLFSFIRIHAIKFCLGKFIIEWIFYQIIKIIVLFNKVINSWDSVFENKLGLKLCILYLILLKKTQKFIQKY